MFPFENSYLEVCQKLRIIGETGNIMKNISESLGSLESFTGMAMAIALHDHHFKLLKSTYVVNVKSMEH